MRTTLTILGKVFRVITGVVIFLMGIACLIIPIIDESTEDVTNPWWLILLFEVFGLLFAFIGWRLMLRKWPWD